MDYACFLVDYSERPAAFLGLGMDAAEAQRIGHENLLDTFTRTDLDPYLYLEVFEWVRTIAKHNGFWRRLRRVSLKGIKTSLMVRERRAAGWQCYGTSVVA